MICEFIKVTPYTDKRGMLKKVFMKSLSQDKNEIEEVYVLYSNRDSVRGNPYHTKTLEYFTVISGRAKVAVKDLFNNHYKEFYISHSDNTVLRVPPFVSHAFLNEDDDPLIILVLSTREYSENDTDTYSDEILH